MVADERLIPILARSFPKILFIGATKNIETRIYDYQIPIGNLFHALNLSHTDVQQLTKPFIKDNPDQTKLVMDLPIFKNNLTCGLSWRSANPKHGQDKSISINDLKEILSVSNLEFVNLQYGDISADANNIKNILGKNLNCVDEIDNFSNIDGLLSVIKSCDVVVTASNITAHLAGAIGKKTFLLLPYSRGRIWYWHDESNSLWYPEIYQYYQDSNMSWQLATQQISKELKGQKIARKN
jgi:ADP-heptose:LPS heptosyltransferase